MSGGGGFALPPEAVGYAVPAFGALFALSFFFSGSETAFFSLQKVDRQRFESAGRTGAQILALLQKRAALISSILLGNETTNIAIGALGAALIALWQPDRPWLNVVLVTPVLILFSEITPKVVAYRYNTAWTQLVVWPLTAFYYAAAPLRVAVTAAVQVLALPFGVSGAAADRGLAEAEIRTLLQQGSGVDERERDLIEAVFEFDEYTVGRLMTPRPDIFAIPLDLPWDELLRRCREMGNSRVPVYDGRFDNIVGVLLLKDLLKYRKRPPAGPRQLRSILWPPTFVPLSKPADDMLREFMERRFHMAFVVDEHGTLVGLITLDDLLAELVGELLDPEDDDTGPELERVEPGVFHVKAYMDIQDFGEETGIELPDGEYTTVGGFVFHELGRLPRRGDSIAHEGNRFTVADIDGRRITEVRVDLAPPSDGEAEAL